MATVKVLVLGSPRGALEPAFTKAASLHAKNSFSFAIVTGDLFGENADETAASLLDGTIKVPLPTYFTVGANGFPASIIAKIEADEEICENLFYLGKRSTTKTTEGIRIVALGGRLDPEVMGGTSKEQHLPFHTAHDAKTLKGAGKADILLTTSWPAGVWTGSKTALTPENQASVSSTQEIAELCDALRPRYHFSPSPGDFFYEREPFFHPAKDDGNEETHVTRFISMGPYGNAAKAKAMYAFTINLSDTTVQPPFGTTASPFLNLRKRKARDTEQQYSRFANGNEDRGRGGGGRRNKRQRLPPPGPDQCFFCLSNPNLSMHMICTVGEDSYLATAKGPLATPATFKDKDLPFPGHIIITPLAHTPTIANSNESYSLEDARRTHAEMTRFREALQAMVTTKSSHKLGAITWEISRGRNIHAHWQFHPFPADMIRNGVAATGFKVEAENLKYPAFEERELTFEDQQSSINPISADAKDSTPNDDNDAGAASGTGVGDFLRVWLWADDGEAKIKGTSLLMRLPDSTGPDNPRFDLQYPRRVVAKLLGLEDRFVWRDCEQTEAEETEDVEKFREAFKPWDFTLQDGDKADE